MLSIAGQTGWTDWAEFFFGHSWVASGCYRVMSLKNLNFFSNFLKIFFFHGQRVLQLVYNNNIRNNNIGNMQIYMEKLR